MNAPWHDEFVALCALYPSGELTEEEWALLQVHLAYCESCQKTFEDYKEIVREVIPAMAAASASEPVLLSLPKAEERPAKDSPADDHFRTRNAARRLIPSLAIAAALAGVGWLGLDAAKQKVQPAASASPQSPVSPGPVQTPASHPDRYPIQETSVHDSDELKQQLRSAEARGQEYSVKLGDMEQTLQAEQNERAKLQEERDNLTQRLAAARQETQLLQERISAGDATVSQQASRLVALEVRLREVTAGIEEKDRLLALDRQLLEHDRDIRDLIGARDLYIADIYDVAQNGKTSKPFGRLFYTKDRSLVFYGYDLDKQPGLKHEVAFQAWGSDGAQRSVSLGLFYQDDKDKRWVLRFKDTKTLAHLNRVFVTAEPTGGSSQPTGKPLLSAYLQMQPNHP